MPKNIFRRPNRKGWYIRTKVNGRSIVRRAYSTAASAQIALADLRRQAAWGELGLPRRTRMTLRDFVDLLRDLHRKSES